MGERNCRDEKTTAKQQNCGPATAVNLFGDRRNFTPIPWEAASFARFAFICTRL